MSHWIDVRVDRAGSMVRAACRAAAAGPSSTTRRAALSRALWSPAHLRSCNEDTTGSTEASLSYVINSRWASKDKLCRQLA